MDILTVQQVKEWDQFTIKNEPVSSIDLMERAATQCFKWIEKQDWNGCTFRVFCAKGNNGGDGLAISRMLAERGFKVFVYILEFGKPGTGDFQTNLERLHALPVAISYIQGKEHLPALQNNEIILDALFGTGLNKPLDGLAEEIVWHMNQSGATIVSIDLPSGLFADRTSKGNTIIKASFTLSFQCLKTGLLIQENAPFFGQVHILDIHLHPGYLKTIQPDLQYIDEAIIKEIFTPRNPFANKGTYGHALLIAGGFGKMGAAVMAAKACLHSGTGLISCHIPGCGYTIMQTALPEVMVMTDVQEKMVTELPNDIDKYAAIGIGPGIGTSEETQNLLKFLIKRYHHHLVIDADGLNCLSLLKDELKKLPANAILTAHPKEFDRIFGEHDNDFDRFYTARQKAIELNCIIVLKSHHTQISTPAGKSYFNSTGNAGMAKGGSGDVLTGIITGLVAQNYDPVHAAILGVYLHGKAGDLAAASLSQEAMVPTDIIQYLGKAFLYLNRLD